MSLVCLISLYQAIVDAELLGFVYHYGLDVNSITVIREWFERSAHVLLLLSSPSLLWLWVLLP